MKTYNEWKSLGLYVKKGEKSAARSSKGEALFSRDQVKSIGDVLPDTAYQNTGGADYHPDLMHLVDMGMASFGIIPSDLELFIEDNESAMKYPDAPEFEDHWTNMRPNG